MDKLDVYQAAISYVDGAEPHEHHEQLQETPIPPAPPAGYAGFLEPPEPFNMIVIPGGCNYDQVAAIRRVAALRNSRIVILTTSLITNKNLTRELAVDFKCNN